VYRARSDFGNLVRVLEIQARHALDVRRKIDLLHEVATACEDGLDDPARAYGALGRALAEDPLDPETTRRLNAWPRRSAVVTTWWSVIEPPPRSCSQMS